MSTSGTTTSALASGGFNMILVIITKLKNGMDITWTETTDLNTTRG